MHDRIGHTFGLDEALHLHRGNCRGTNISDPFDKRLFIHLEPGGSETNIKAEYHSPAMAPLEWTQKPSDFQF